MKIETIGDVVHWARQYHERLSSLLESSSSLSANDERVKLLLSYLSSHEQKLSDLLEHMEASGDIKALHTFVYDYLDSSPFKPHPGIDDSWAGLEPNEIIMRIEHEHNQLIALYRHLHSRVDTVSGQELLDELISLEEHEAMRIAQSANRFSDY